MSRIFISHSTANNAEAVAVRDWMIGHGWDDVFLDLDPERGLKAGERWQEALKRAAERCEMIIFLVSPVWAASKWCLAEFLLAKSLNKRIFAAIVAPTPLADLPTEMTAEWQVVDLTAGALDYHATVPLPPGDTTVDVALASDGLNRLRIGLQQAGLDAKYFAWPPANDPKRPPYRGLKPLEADDAGIFFGRDGSVVGALDALRGLREAAPPRLLVILGASGAGKSSFLRAGLVPRLVRDSHNLIVLPIVRPERSVVSGEAGLLRALEIALPTTARADLRAAIEGGAATLRPVLQALIDKKTSSNVAGKPPTLILAIDQGEELFLAEGQGEARSFLALLRELLIDDAPALIALFTIRSDNYERLQQAEELEGVRQTTLSLPPMPKGSYADVIKGPARRLDGTARAIKIDDALVDALLADIETGGAKDALPLLAFTLERLYKEYGATGHLTLEHFNKLGRVKGSIEAAVERAFAAADMDARVPRDREARLTLLRRGLIPWLAGIDPDTKAPRRRVALLSELPIEARPLVDLLVEQRLLSTDVAKDTGETTIEPAHEALLRQWGLLQGWLSDDTGLLTVLDGIKRGARDWAANAKAPSWLAHAADRLRAAEQLLARPDLAANLEPMDRSYVHACRRQETKARQRARRGQIGVGALATLVLAVLALGVSGLLDPLKIMVQVRGLADRYGPSRVLSEAQELQLRPGDIFKECVSCPEMVVVPAGAFRMGSEERDDAKPEHKITISAQLAVGKFTITFDEWDACVASGGCPYRADDVGFGRGRRPVIVVSWNDVKDYLAWLSKLTGKTYRLLTEAEWEYAARAGTTTRYFWGDEVGENNANCDGCKSQWDNKQTAPVGSFKPNAFGLYDMHGNVWQWVQDCYDEKGYVTAPMDGSAAQDKSGCLRVRRGGSSFNDPRFMRSAVRFGIEPASRYDGLGFRVARDLSSDRTP